MLKGMFVWLGQFIISKQRRAGLALFVIAMLVLIHCISKNHARRILEPPILYQGSHLVIPEKSALRSVIQVATVHPQAVVTSVIVPATIQAIPANTSAILLPLTGQITKIFKRIGEPVKQDEPLVALVSSDLATAVATKISAAAAFALAQKNLKRQLELAHYEINAVRDLEQAESDMQQTEAELQRSIAVLENLHVKPGDSEGLGHLLIRSPINGVVTAVNAGVGTYWSDLTSPVITVADLSKVYAVASAQEHDLPDFFLGQSTQVILDRLDARFAGLVEFIDPILNPDTRTVRVGLSLNNPLGNLRPNMFARMKFKRKSLPRILLPMTAVIQRGFDSIVFVETAPWEFEARVVKVGLQVADQMVIESGLVDKERVALTGGIILND